MKTVQQASGIEINAKFVGAFFTEQIENKLRVFCFFINGGTSQFDLALDENFEKLQGFHAKLNMDETCSSVILDQVVQGRVYVRSEENCWLYTVLSTPGSVMPVFNGSISDLAWKYCWRSQAADVLEYGNPGDPVHCFAIRTQITENDAARLVKDSKAFTNPVSAQKKKPHRPLHLAIGVVLVFLAIMIGLTAFYTLRQKTSGSFESTVAAGAVAEPMADAYYLLYKRQISGPYPVKIIIGMNAGGLLSPDTMCRSGQSAEWVSLTNLLPPPPAK